MAELFLQELEPLYLVRSPENLRDFIYDFLIGFQKSSGGIDTYGILLKATQRPISGRYQISVSTYKRLACSNIPALLLVIDVKQNHLFYSWISEDKIKDSQNKNSITVPVTKIDDAAKEALRKQLAGERSDRAYPH